jgi:hypothetical protein
VAKRTERTRGPLLEGQPLRAEDVGDALGEEVLVSHLELAPGPRLADGDQERRDTVPRERERSQAHRLGEEGHGEPWRVERGHQREQRRRVGRGAGSRPGGGRLELEQAVEVTLARGDDLAGAVAEGERTRHPPQPLDARERVDAVA